MNRVSIVVLPESGSVARDADFVGLLQIIRDNVRAIGWKCVGSWVSGFAPYPSLAEILHSDAILIYSMSHHDATVKLVEAAEYESVLPALGIVSPANHYASEAAR
jgi:hypothetical protein